MDSIDFVNMNLIDMDCIHVVPNNQIPDESYIERLFPKCSPKQSNDNDNGDDSSPTKSSSNKFNSNKPHRRRRLRPRRPKTKDQASALLDNNHNINDDPTDNFLNNYRPNGLGSGLPQRPSKLQFNTLSDNDSGAEDSGSCPRSQVVLVEKQVKGNRGENGSTEDEQATTVTTCKIVPSMSTVSMFPKLDEGLSSDANDSDGDILNRDDYLIEADDEDDEQVNGTRRSHKSKLDNGSNCKVPTTKSLNKSSSVRLLKEEIVDQTVQPSSDTDIETDRLLGSQRSAQKIINSKQTGLDGASPETNNLPSIPNQSKPANSSNFREVLIEGVLFNVKYLGSTHTDCEGGSDKENRISQAEMAVHEVKLRNEESNGAIEVQLFISTEKVMVLDDRYRKLLMDHSLRTISYIADIGDAIVLIVKTKPTQSSSLMGDNQQNSSTFNTNRSTSSLPVSSSRISCHVFESNESHIITKSISQAFQVAYAELLKANGNGSSNVEPGNFAHKESDYQQVLNSQEMSTEELEMFARRENQREIIVPKQIGEIIGLSIVESGWGSVLPTVVIANIKQDGPADKCKKLSVGYQILSVNGISLVGLPLAECQEILRKTKQQSVARLSIVPGPITVEVKIKRPDTKYQLGFSVQNGVICSLLRGGIAERGGVRVGHRIMSINGTTVVGAPHDKIVNMLANSVGEIRMITCLTSLYKLILGEEKPIYF